MTSEIRANTLKNRVGLGTVSFTNTGAVVSGIVTANSFSGPLITTSIDLNGDLDVDGHTHLDNVNVAGVTTFAGITDFDNIFRVGDTGGFPSSTQSSRITRKDNHPAGLTFDYGSSPTLEIGSKVGEVVIGSNSYGNAPVNFKTGVTLGTLSGGTTQMQMIPTGINITKDLDVDGHTNLDNVSIAGVTTITGSGNALEIVGGLVRSRNTASARFVANNGSAEGYFGWSSGVLTVGQAAATLSLEATGSNHIQLKTNGLERVRIDSNGRLLVSRGGLTASRNVGTKTGEIQVANSGNSSAITIIGYSNDVGGPHLVFGKSRAGNATGSTVLQSGDRLGEIAFCGADGTDIDSFGAAIKAHVDGTPGANDMPGRLEFYTTSDGGSSAVERLRITSTGNIGAGNANPDAFYTHAKNLVIGSGSGGEGITIYSGTDSSGYIGFNDTASNSMQGFIQYNHDGNYMAFGPNGSEKVRIDSAGRLLVNTTSSSISSSELFEVKSTSSGFSHFRNNHSGYAPIYIDNEYTNTAMAPLITITDGGGNRAGLLLDPNSVFDITGQGGISFSTSGTVGNAIERVRVSNQGNIIFKDKDSGHTGGGRYSRTKTVNNTGDSTTTFMRFTLDHGAIAGMIFLTASNSGYSVAKTYAFVAQYGQTVTTNLLADTGAYSGANISFTSSTSNNQHNFMVQVSGQNQEVNMTVILGNANQNVSYQEI